METLGANAVFPRKTLHGFVPMHGPGLAVARLWRHHAVLELRFTDGKLSLDYSRSSHLSFDYPQYSKLKHIINNPEKGTVGTVRNWESFISLQQIL